MHAGSSGMASTSAAAGDPDMDAHGHGYGHRDYARSMAEFGTPVALPRSGGWILRRAVPGSDDYDGTGCYPLFACRDWSGLRDDLAGTGGSLLTLALVADPFGDYRVEDLRDCFDLVTPFKAHCVTDLRQDPGDFLPRSHVRNLASAAAAVVVEQCLEPIVWLDQWVDLYAGLVAERGMRGQRAFSAAAFAVQLAMPGMVMFRATAGDAVVGLHLWIVQGEVAYGHLGATSPRGRDLMASYALYAHAIEHFRSQVRWLDLGAGAGLSERHDGLWRFKRGWATGTRPAYFCGRIFDDARYRAVVAARGGPATDYFPAYRSGEV